MSDFDCQVKAEYRSACKDLPQYQETGFCVLHFPGGKKDDFAKAKKWKLNQEDYDFSGTVFPGGTSDFTKFVFDGNAHFTGATFVGEAGFWSAQFSGKWTDFSGAQFSGDRTDFQDAKFSSDRTDFSGARFSSEWADFRGVEFNGEWTDFSTAQFSGKKTKTSFSDAKFSGETTYFSGAQFSGETTYFSNAQFSGKKTYFSYTQFGSAETSFQEATFAKEVYFRGVTFSETVTFSGTQENRVFGPGAWASFDRSRIDKPEQVTFHTVLLHPSWFINSDVRKVNFTDVSWYGMPGGPKGALDEELFSLEEHKVEPRHTILAQACRRLSANAEENREYPLANEFYYWSMDALRIGSWSVIYEALLKEEVRQDIKEGEHRDINFKDLLRPKALDARSLLRKDTWHHVKGRRRFGLVNSLYWALSGYGVRAARALWVLLGICAAFAALYILVGPSELQAVGQTVVYSLGAIARLNPEPKPTEPGLFQFLVVAEGILGPLQIALLALAVRRKVMR